MSDPASAESLPHPSATEFASRRVFQVCYLANFTQLFGLAASSGIALLASKVFGITQEAIGYFFAGNVFTFVLAAVLSTFAVKKFGCQRLLLLSAALQATFALLVFTAPLIFNLGGGGLVCGWLGLAVHLLAVGGGITLATTLPLVAAHSRDNCLLGLHQFYTAVPVAFIFSTVVHQLGSQSLQFDLVILLILVAAYGIALFWFPLAVAPRPAIAGGDESQSWTALLKPLFGLLLLMLSLVDFCNSQGQYYVSQTIAEISGNSTVVGFFFVAAFVRILLHLCIGYVRQIATDFEVLLLGSILLLLGCTVFANANSQPMLYKAVLLTAAGTALLEPTLLAVVADRYGEQGIASLGWLASVSLVIATLFAACLPATPIDPKLEYLQHWWSYFAIVPAVMAVCYGSLVAYFGESKGYRILSKMHWPKDTVLATLLSWGLFGCVTAVATAPKSTDLQSYIGQFFLTAVYGYVFGPFWSSFWWISLPAMLLFGYIAAVILFRWSDQTELARSAFTYLCILGLFTIWAEPWLTIDGLLMNMATRYLNITILGFVDIAASVGWFFAWTAVHRSLDRI